MRTVTIFTVFALVLLVTSLGFSQYSARESFEYPQGDSLAQKGTATNGFAGPWTQYVSAGWGNVTDRFTDSTASILVGTTPLSYNNLLYPITNVGSHVSVFTPGNWSATAVYQRHLDKTWPNTAGKKYWVSFIFEQGPIQASKTAYDNSTFYTVKLLYNTNELLAIGKQGGANVYSCGSGWSGNPAEASLVEMTSDPVWLVTKMVMTGTADTVARTFMWINPDPTSSEPDTATADVKTWTRIPDGFNTVTVSNGGNDSITTSFDEIRLGDSWALVSSPQYSARESFEYSQGDSLAQKGTATNGFAGPWTQYVSAGWGNVTDRFTDSTASILVGTTPLSYNNLLYPITNVGSHVSVFTPGNWSATAVYQRHLDKTWPNTAGKKYWVSFIFEQGPIQASKTAYDNSTFYTVKLLYNTNELLAIGKQGGANVYSCGSGWSGNPAEASLVEMTSDPVWLVTKMVMTGTADTVARTFMWINPDPTSSEPDTATADVKTWTRIPDGFNTVTVSNGGNDSITTSFDEIRLGTDWASVSLPVAQLTGIIAQASNNQPNRFALLQNYPNPFNPSTKISYTLKSAGNTRLTVYDLLGREVAVLVDGVQTSGLHTATFSANRFASGVYFYRLESSGMTMIKKMLLLK